MRIALSLLAFRPGRVGGAETYVRRLIEHLPAHAGSDRLTAFLDEDLAASLHTPGFERVVVPVGAPGLVARRILEAFSPYRARRLARTMERAADVVLFPQQSIFPLDVKVPAVVTVHDMQHLVLPENFGAFDRHFRARVYPRSFARAARVIAISEQTKREIVEACGVDRDRVEVLPHGFARTGERAPAWSPGYRYLYFPAATHPHKGHDVLLQCFAALRAYGIDQHRLVLTGQRTSHWTELARLARTLGVEDRVVHLGFVPEGEIRSVYAGADAVVFPTRYEGFGLPVLEAVALGKKIVVSRLPIFDELGVPAQWQIDFGDPAQLAAALSLDGPTLLERQPLPWAEVARRTIDVVRRAAGAPAPEALR